MSRVFDEFYFSLTADEQCGLHYEAQLQELACDCRALAEIDRLRAAGLPIPEELQEYEERPIETRPRDPAASDTEDDIPF